MRARHSRRSAAPAGRRRSASRRRCRWCGAAPAAGRLAPAAAPPGRRCRCVGSIVLMKARMPCLAESSLVPDIDPVRSSTIITSSGSRAARRAGLGVHGLGDRVDPDHPQKRGRHGRVLGDVHGVGRVAELRGWSSSRRWPRLVTVPAPTIGFLPSSAELKCGGRGECRGRCRAGCSAPAAAAASAEACSCWWTR